MITTVTLNPAIDREYFVDKNEVMKNQFIYNDEDLKIYPGGKGLISAINFKSLGYQDVQNIGFVGGKQGMFFEKMVQKQDIISNYIYTESEIRNNVKIIGREPATYTQYNDYTYRVEKEEVKELIVRFKRSISESKCILISGSVPEGVDFDIYQRLIKIAKDKGKHVFLQASGEALKLALKSNPDIVTPYFKHHKTILDMEMNDKEDYIRAGKEIQKQGAKRVMIPFHCDRLLFDKNGDVYQLSPKGYCIVNWLGSSDAYNTGYLDYAFQTEDFDFLEANLRGGAAALWIAENKEIYLQNREDYNSYLDRLEINKLEV
ncbi:1-phosphofructokinase [Halanaerobium saccharolyticum]|uniref:Tagatose-6-phosphate kinase n=1 Tax=Halanaerobium saccharolyticum TaxID=43595 RepID=A0A4R6M3N2_9FIRM|nr:PfkB family carbohydrate kinase [Halanaerobium saccharolyticum]TDO95090.1 1-phosphofructokinase [Halanaerobium saccharolyticum]